MTATPHLIKKSDWLSYSKIYDIYYGNYVDDMKYLSSRWQANWLSVAEIGVGTGRLISFFKSHGVQHFIGFDTCRGMLNIALEKPTLDNFSLVEGDFLDHEVNDPFDLFVYAFNTANYILDPMALQRHLQKCRSHLRNDGAIFLDFYLPFAITRGEDSAEYRTRERVKRSERVFELRDRRFYDPVSHIEERHQMSLETVDDEPQRELHFQTYRRHYCLQEIERMAANAGLRVTCAEEYGSGYAEGFYIFLSR